MLINIVDLYSTNLLHVDGWSTGTIVEIQFGLDISCQIITAAIKIKNFDRYKLI